MKLIFLDIDGVLNSVQQSIGVRDKAYRACEINKVSLGLLKWICEVTDAKIVISSTWKSEGADWMKGVFEAHRWVLPPIIGTTRHPSPNIRGNDIEAFLQDFDEQGEETEYVIIDDSADMLEHQMGNLVRTDPVVGFTLYDVVKVIDTLGGVLPEHEDLFENVRAHTTFKDRKREETKFNEQ